MPPAGRKLKCGPPSENLTREVNPPIEIKGVSELFFSDDIDCQRKSSREVGG